MTHNEKHPGVPASLYIGGTSVGNGTGQLTPQGHGTVAPGASVETGPLKIVDLSANQRALLEKQFQLIAERLGKLEELEQRIAKLESRGPRCQKCGQYQNEPGICWTFETPSGYPEPNGEHEWK